MVKAVFFDRDGTLNRGFMREGRSYPPATVDEFELLPGVPAAVQALKDAGYAIIVVTNQPDVGAGKQRQDEVERIHAELRRLIPVDDVRVCYHTNQDGCACRKPLPGMLVEAARANRIDLSHSYMVGDRWRDVEAGRAAGCHTIFIRNSYAERQPDDYDAAVDSVVEASRLILSGAFSDRRQERTNADGG